MLKRKQRPTTYGKETKGDGTWKLEVYPLEHPNEFQKWGAQRYKMTPLGWIEMGEELRYFERRLADSLAAREGYSKVA